MKLRTLLAIMLMSAFALSTTAITSAEAKGADYSQVLATANKAVEAGKEGKADLLVQYAEEALRLAKEISNVRTTAASQRITEDLRAAVEKGKQGKIEEATKSIEAAIPNMK